jgi:hypothetical protein
MTVGADRAKGPIRIVRCPLDRMAELQAFIGAHWRAGHILSRDAELLRWQHRAGSNELAVLVAMRDEAIIGMLGLIPIAFNLRGRKLRGNWLALWATAKGGPPALGMELLGAAMREGEFTGVLGANKAAMTVYRGLKWATIDAVPRFVRIASSDALERLLGAEAKGTGQIVWAAGIEARASSSVVEGAHLLESWDQAWQGEFAPLLVSTWKDADYLRWRYLDHPRFRYEVLFGRDASGRIAGCAVYRIVRIPERSSSVMRVVEFLGHGAVADELAGHLAYLADAQGVAFGDFYCTSAALAAPLIRQGFVAESRLPAAVPNLLQPVDFSRTKLTAAFHVQSSVVPDSWGLLSDELYFTRSDGDQDRPN